MIAATFNVNSVRSRVEIVRGWLGSAEPDVLCLQETKVQDSEFPLDAFADTGYHIAFSGEKRYNGVAIFSRREPDEVRIGFDEPPLDASRLIAARFGEVWVVNTYVPQGQSPDSEKFQYKLAWFTRLRELFASRHRADEPVLWMGDLNVAMDDRDVYDPVALRGSVCFCEPVQQALGEVASWGFTDVFRMHNPQDQQYTFWDYRLPNSLKRNLGWRIDYIMATESLAARCRRCWIDKEPRAAVKPSDHTFLAAEFDI